MKKSLIFSIAVLLIFFAINVFLISIEFSVSESMSEILFALMMLILLITLFVVNFKYLPQKFTGKHRIIISSISTSFDLALFWICIYFFNWYVFYPIVR